MSGARRDVALVLAASLAFATAGPLGKVAAGVPAVVVASARTGIAAIAIASALRGRVLPHVAALDARRRVAVAGAGALLAAHFALFLGGLASTSLAAAVALVSLEPLAVVLAAFLAFGLRPTRRELLGIVLATGGAFVVASGAGVGEHRLSGDLMVLGAVALYGAYVAAARGLRDAMPALPYAAAVYATASLLLLPAAVPLAVRAPRPGGGELAAILALGLVPTVFGHTLVQIAARRAPPALVALVSPGETIGALALGAAALGAAPTAREGAGAALVVLGAVLAVTGRRAPPDRGRR